jgi:preprotein translocase SecE subunit
MSLIQYIKDTRGELNHVAWPTRTQTSVFTILVILISVLVSLYLGIFDYLFTRSLGRGLELLPQQQGQVIDLQNLETLPEPIQAEGDIIPIENIIPTE